MITATTLHNAEVDAVPESGEPAGGPKAVRPAAAGAEDEERPLRERPR